MAYENEKVEKAVIKHVTEVNGTANFTEIQNRIARDLEANYFDSDLSLQIRRILNDLVYRGKLTFNNKHVPVPISDENPRIIPFV